MHCEQVIERLKSKIPTIYKSGDDHTVYGITQLDIQCSDGSVKQIVLLFERLRVDEPQQLLKRRKIYADVLIKISDELLTDIASKEVSLDDAIEQKLFEVYGDFEVWNRQLKVLKAILPHEQFDPRRREVVEPDPPVVETPRVVAEFIDYGNLPEMDLSKIPPEFQFMVDHFKILRNKYSMKRVTFGPSTMSQ